MFAYVSSIGSPSGMGNIKLQSNFSHDHTEYLSAFTYDATAEVAIISVHTCKQNGHCPLSLASYRYDLSPAPSMNPFLRA